MKHIPFHIPTNIFQSTFLLWPIGIMVGLFLAIIIFVRFGTKKHIEYDATKPGLYGVTGRFGSGKSYFLTWLASMALKKGRLVFATYELRDHKTFTQWKTDFDAGILWVGPVLIEPSVTPDDDKGWHQILQVPHHSTVIIDEAQGWWPSDAWKAPPEVRMWLSTIRHRGITVLWGTQWVNAVAKWLRELSYGIWECQHSKAGHTYTLFDPRFIAGKPGTRKFEARIRLRRSQAVMDMYDTHNDAAMSIQWGGGEDPGTAGARVRSPHTPPPTRPPASSPTTAA